MSPADKARALALTEAIGQYQEEVGSLPGIAAEGHLETLVAQIIDSLRRIEFVHHIRDARHDPARMDPSSPLFDPLKAAVLRSRRGEADEAWWLVFLATHFGKHITDGWRLARDVYGRLGQGGHWNWAATSQSPAALQSWFVSNEGTLRGSDGVTRRFSNHRQYESLRASSAAGTPRIVASYVAWVSPPRTHSDLVRQLHQSVGQDPQAVFAALYGSMDAVHRFGRLGRFDFLAMLGKLGIAPIDPGSTFLTGATGPLKGARLLYAGSRVADLSARHLDAKLAEFGRQTGLGSQALEDALCNWQKSPGKYARFRG
ncbi:hypothetical protein [uncultured Enterovirga sp.]|uniref:alpha-glutamyl/putrescinyl thymine pyrophosphorylase clade 3 protein n=1 Tax=uncultured Enterovirga sp. TaxID=2026352 RepID=UPI0035CA61E2